MLNWRGLSFTQPTTSSSPKEKIRKKRRSAVLSDTAEKNAIDPEKKKRKETSNNSVRIQRKKKCKNYEQKNANNTDEWTTVETFLFSVSKTLLKFNVCWELEKVHILLNVGIC